MRFIRPTVLALIAAALVGAALVHADPVALETTEIGQGPAIVFVHGLGQARLDWLPTVKRLREHYRTVLVDLPGHGKSAMPDPFTLTAAGEALDQVLAKQKGESTLVVGQGVGGLVALAALSAHPTHAAGVVLIDVQARASMIQSDQQRQMFFKFLDENYEQFAQMAFHKMGRDSAESERLYAGMAALAPVTVKAYMHELLMVDANKQLKGLPVPPTLVFTDRGWKGNEPWGTIAKQFGIDDSTLAVPHRVRNAGPLVMKDQPDTLAALLADAAVKSFAAAKKK